MKNIRFGKAFKISYLIFLGVLIVLVALALFHVNSVLEQYENEHPQRHLEKAVSLLIKEAEDGTLWNKEGVPSMESGAFEANADQKADFIKKIKGDIKFSSAKWIDEENCTYGIISDGITIAELTLRKVGPAVQKLAIISIQEYELVSYKPICHTYTVKLPSDVKLNEDIFVEVNGISLAEEMGEQNKNNEFVFTLKELYSKPEISITDKMGNKADYRLPSSTNGEIEFDNCFYTLTLPSSLAVNIDGEKMDGEKLEDGRFLYRIRLAKKAKVELSDAFGNKADYRGNSSVALTHYSFMTDKNNTVTVDGNKIPDELFEAVTLSELDSIKPYVKEFPEFVNCEIVVLKNNADIKITSEDGKEIPFNKDEKIQNITSLALNVSDTVPEEVSKEVDVLKVLQDWSLFMTCDLDFASLSKHLIKSSDQYKVAYKYNNSIERNQFISRHTLLNPPFIEENVSNFTWITEDSFCVDVKFTKQMMVSGKKTNDEMNERCYFVKYDDTNDKKDNPKWKLVGMKEIVNDTK